jgi:ribosomal protein S12 methylthiotransferase
LSQRYKDELRKELPQVDAFVGTLSLNHQHNLISLSPKHYAYLKICEGCLKYCSYCVIPNIKPRFQSLEISSILKKVEIFDKNGICELNIIGQDISSYGIDLYGECHLTLLLKRIIKKTKNIGWLRLLYLYPSRISDELLDLIADQPRICKYLDLPIQHINERILRLMHRATTKKTILKLLEKARKKIPQVAIRTSIIVGFPSETDREFKELLNFLEDTRFERLGAFVYSQEAGTPAYNFKKQIPEAIKIERFNTIMSKQQKISQELNCKFLGKIIDVLIDEEGDDYFLGRSQYDAPQVDGLVYVNSKKKLKPGDFVKVKICDTLEYDLVGDAYNEHS